MSPDADRPLLEKAGLSGTGAATVMENLIIRCYHDIGNQLLQRGILFSFLARYKEVILRFKKDGEVAGNIGIQALERTQFVKEGTTDDKNLFSGAHGSYINRAEQIQEAEYPGVTPLPQEGDLPTVA